MICVKEHATRKIRYLFSQAWEFPPSCIRHKCRKYKYKKRKEDTETQETQGKGESRNNRIHVLIILPRLQHLDEECRAGCNAQSRLCMRQGDQTSIYLELNGSAMHDIEHPGDPRWKGHSYHEPWVGARSMESVSLSKLLRIIS